MVGAFDKAQEDRNEVVKCGSVEKTREDVLGVYRKMCAWHPPRNLPDGWLEDPDEKFDFHRTIWQRDGDGLKIVDGTHRMLAVAWHRLVNTPRNRPNLLYCLALDKDHAKVRR